MPAPDAVATTPEARRHEAHRRLASLDGLRGLAALSIFAFHGWLYTMPTPDATSRSSVGDYAVHELRLGVVLFFVLSGFLLSRPWFAAALERRASPDLGRYVRARAARILPAYYAALLGSIALLWSLGGTPGLRLPPVQQLPLFVVFGQNFSPGSVMKLDPPMWTLAIEVSFYLVLPAIGWLLLRLPARRRTLALVPVGLLALGTTYNWSIAGEGLSMTFSKNLLATVPCFAVGMLAALAAHGRTIGMAAKRRLLVAGALIVACDAIAKAGAPATGIDATELFTTIRDLPSAVGFGLIVVGLALAPRSAIVGGRVLATVGTISYGFYLWHVPVYLVLRGHGLLPLDPLAGAAVALVPALALSTISWFALERPALRWLARRERALRLRRRAGRELGGRELGAAEVGTARA